MSDSALVRALVTPASFMARAISTEAPVMGRGGREGRPPPEPLADSSDPTNSTKVLTCWKPGRMSNLYSSYCRWFSVRPCAILPSFVILSHVRLSGDRSCGIAEEHVQGWPGIAICLQQTCLQVIHMLPEPPGHVRPSCQLRNYMLCHIKHLTH